MNVSLKIILTSILYKFNIVVTEFAGRLLEDVHQFTTNLCTQICT